MGWHWLEVKDGNPLAYSIYERHYSYKISRQKSGQPPKQRLFLPPGEKMALLAHGFDAVFGWVHNTVERFDHETGVCCTLFRNEGPVLSSELILEAEWFALHRWPEHARRMFTYIDPNELASTNPGYCFKMAGWRFVRKATTTHRLLFEKVNTP